MIHSSSASAIIRLLAAGGLLLTLLACSNSNNRAPVPGRSHPAGYLLDHAADASADLTSCRSCHQADLKGGGNATSCYTCHEEDNGNGGANDFAIHSLPYADPDQHGAAARNDQAGCLACHGTPPNRFDGGILADDALYGSAAPTCNSAACHPAAGAHPTNWQGTNDTNGNGYAASHRVVGQAAIDTGCALCHQVTEGGPAPLAEAPSCFNATFTNSDGSTTGCHSDGRGEGAHAIPYTAPDLHGPSARADLGACQACHGNPGSADFDGGTAAVSCATNTCHPAAGAHPTNWQGTNDTNDNGYDASHRVVSQVAIDTDCALCHQVTEGGPASMAEAPSCFNASFTNSDGTTTGCHAGGPGQGAHAIPFVSPDLHGAPAKADLAACQACHGSAPDRFDGGITAVSCATTTCHPAAGAHPTNWQGTNDTNGNGYDASHRVVSQVAIDTDCALCHQVTEGGPAPMAEAPSCFNASFTNSDGSATGCHTGGPGESAHVIPYTAPDLHGDTAKADLAACQACHGTPGSTDFDGGVTAVSCATAACHPSAGAHPTRWQGTNDNNGNGYASSHRDAVNAESGCAICHDVTEGRSAPNRAAPSCFAPRFTNSDGSATACHSTGPGTVPHALPYNTPQRHGAAAKADLSDCQACHGDPGETGFNGGTADTGCATDACHPAAGAHPTNWQGDNDPTTDYLSSHRNAGRQEIVCAICHDVTEGRTAPNGTAPSCFSTSFTNGDGNTSGCHGAGPGAAHALPFTDPADHGPEAKADLTACLACHATPADAGPGDNPRFNLPVGDLPQGCETSGCHSPFTAHPEPLWAGAEATSHVSAGNQTEACALCHGANLNGGGGAVGPACASCHELGSPLDLGNCASCHATPPNDSAGTRPNRDGAHGAHQGYPGVTDNCTVCHSGAGSHTNSHFDTSAPATIRMLTTYNSQGSTAGFDAASGTCSNIRCHGGRTTPSWYGGRIDLATDCESCHTYGTGEYNGYRSDGHDEHRWLTCTRCHDAAILAEPNGAHLSNLATTAFEQDALDTVLPLGQSCQQSGCHGSGVDFGDWWDDDD